MLYVEMKLNGDEDNQTLILRNGFLRHLIELTLVIDGEEKTINICREDLEAAIRKLGA